MAALVTGNQATASVIERGLNDADAEVRRFAAAAAATDARIDERDRIIKIALADKEPRVRLEALRAWGRHFQKTSCAPIRAALKDPNPHVMLQAIDQLGNACPGAESPAADLRAIAESLTNTPRAWHAPAHAVVSLARQQPEAARSAAAAVRRSIRSGRCGCMPRAPPAFSALIDELDDARGRSERQRPEAALAAMIDLKRPKRRPPRSPRWRGRLSADPDRSARARRQVERGQGDVAALITALGRITAEHKDTSRDPRMAILNRLHAYGDASQAVYLEGYLKDFDPAIAQKTAEILTEWTGKPRTASPQPLTPPGVTTAMVGALRGKSLRFHMAGRGYFDIGLDVDAAPLTAIRIARRAGEGYYNGLTFHRIAPNFVIQGGSPGANEYMGEHFYMRDEVGLHCPRHGRHLDARPRHRRRADLRQPDRLAAARSHLHRVRHRGHRHGRRRWHSRRRCDRARRAGQSMSRLDHHIARFE